MKTLTVKIKDTLSENVINAVLGALNLEYNIDDETDFQDETECIMANSYLSERLVQGRKDMEDAKGTKIALDDIWK